MVGIGIFGLVWLLILFGIGLTIMTFFLRLAVRMMRWGGTLLWGERVEIGAPLQVCPHPGCDRTNGPGAKFCGRCGRPLGLVDRYG